TLVVVPGSVNIERIAPPESNYHLIPVFRYAPHVNLDHMAETLQHPFRSSNLNVYLVARNPPSHVSDP
ncbi:hypothetical protein GGH95_006113, partial [Coemansia sp. RSA 1836]